jgi:deoxyribodipyrimidine photo-lyase
MRYQMDSDPLSNTCSWRWATGLRTAGKVCDASATSIAIVADGCFTGTQGLAASAAPMAGANPRAEKLRSPRIPDPEVMNVRQITEDDCHSESLSPLDLVATATIALTSSRSDRTIAEAVAG